MEKNRLRGLGTEERYHTPGALPRLAGCGDLSNWEILPPCRRIRPELVWFPISVETNVSNPIIWPCQEKRFYHLVVTLACGVRDQVWYRKELPSWEPPAVTTDRKKRVFYRGGFLYPFLLDSSSSHEVTSV